MPIVPPFFDGDSHVHALMALVQQTLQEGSYNVSLFARGGCLTPYFSPWPGGGQDDEKYKLCRAHDRSRARYLKSALKPGDRVVVDSFVHGLFDSVHSRRSYGDSVLSLARDVQSKGASLVVFAPIPVFADAAKIAFPLGLCRVAWFRPSWVLSAACQPAWLKRDREIRDTSAVRDLLLALDREVTAVKVFDPFPILCPVGQSCCSTYCVSQRIFRGGHHLTDALKLYPFFRAFLAGIDAGSPHGSSPIHSSTSP